MAVDPTSGDAPGWYGKLSALGDFAERRLPRGLVRLADAWLSQAITASRQQLGDAWLEVYLTAPLLRFAWAPGIVDAGWWFGVMMPSCDNVGRYFPLLIATRRDRPPQDGVALEHLDAWFDHLAHAATATLGDGASVDAFEHALGEAPPWPAPGTPEVFASPATGAGERHALGPRTDLHRWLHGVASEVLQSRFAGCSIWWQPGCDGLAATANVVHGLPQAEAFATMLAAG